MKSKKSAYISGALLILFLFTFSVQNASALSRNTKAEDISSNIKDQKSFHIPGAASNSDNDLYENESVDEVETEFNSEFPVLSTHHAPRFELLSFDIFHQQFEVKTVQDAYCPLYLVICIFRI